MTNLPKNPKPHFESIPSKIEKTLLDDKLKQIILEMVNIVRKNKEIEKKLRASVG